MVSLGTLCVKGIANAGGLHRRFREGKEGEMSHHRDSHPGAAASYAGHVLPVVPAVRPPQEGRNLRSQKTNSSSMHPAGRQHLSKTNWQETTLEN